MIAGRTGHLISTYSPFVWYKPHRWLSAGIRAFTGSKWGHSAALIDLWGEWYVIEMDPSPRITPFEKWKQTDKVMQVSEFKFLYNDKLWASLALGKQDGGTKYDYFSLFIYQPIYILTGQWIGRKSNKADTRLYCSEYIALIWNKMFANAFPEWWTTTPRDLVDSNYFKVLYEGKAKDLTIV